MDVLEYVKGTYICFRDQPHLRKKTQVWFVTSEKGGLIGEVKWFGAWRKYCFFPEADSVYEQVCLREIADFCEARTKEHRKRKD